MPRLKVTDLVPDGRNANRHTARRVTLSHKQRLFVEEYLHHWNASRAARAAGYSPKTAPFIGAENLKKPLIAAAIQARIRERAMSADEVLDRLARQGRADIGAFIDDEGQLDINALKEAKQTDLIKKLVFTERTFYPKSGGTVVTRKLTTGLHDAQTALIQLGRHHGLFSEKLIVSFQEEIAALLIKGVITAEQVRQELGDELAEELFRSIPLPAGGVGAEGRE